MKTPYCKLLHAGQDTTISGTKACSHLPDLMKLTNTIKAILSEFSRGESSEGFSLSYK